MDPQGRIPRRRGSVCGVLLILLGLWGGLAPFVGPYLHYGYTPDKTWYYSSGRLYYSVIPAAAVLIGGVFAVITRNRGVGVCAGLLATLGGIWFGFGQTVLITVLKKTSITPGSPILHDASATALRTVLEGITLFGGLGILVAIVGALAMGRFSLMAADDIDADTVYSDFQPTTGHREAVS